MGVFIRGAVIAGSLCAANAARAGFLDRPFLRASSVVIVIGATEDDTSGGAAPYVVDFNLLTSAPNTPAHDIIGVDAYVMNSQSGWLPGLDFSAGASRLELQNQTSGGAFSNSGDPDYLEVTDSYTAFGIDGTTDITTRQHRKVSRFLVVSNTKFDVYAQASNLIKTDDFAVLDYENIGIRIRLNVKGGTGPGRWGDMAQNPRIGGTGLDPSINDLGDLSGVAVKVFDGGRRTAADPGTLLEQAVSFNIRYALSPNADSSNINAYDFSMGTGNIGAEVSYTIYTP